MSVKSATKKNDSVWSPAVIAVAIVCAVVLVALLAFALVARTGYFRRNNIVMEIDGKQINQIEFEYYYSSKLSLYDQYFSLSSSGTNLKTAKCYMDSTLTWHEYFMQEAKKQIINDYLLSAAAEKENFGLSEASKETIEGLPATFEAQAELYSMSVDGFLSAAYSRNVTMEDVIGYVTRSSLASDYATNFNETRGYTDEDIEKYYNEKVKDFAVSDYYYFEIKAAGDKTVDQIKDEFAKLDEALTAASDDAAKDAVIAAFKEKVKELSGTTSSSSTENSTTTEFDYSKYMKEKASYVKDDAISEWVFGEGRFKGEVEIIEKTSGTGSSATKTYTAVCYVSTGKDMSDVGNMRHILFRAEVQYDENGNKLTDSEGKDVTNTAEMKKKAEDLLAKWNAGDKTEDSFVALVKDNTDDTASKYTGGLYENFDQGYMNKGIDEWIFPADETKRPAKGDVKVVEADSSYHLVYFLGYEKAWKADVESAMISEAFDKYFEGLKSAATISYNQENLAKVG